jgi:sugar phosphate isomerase/epimerase
MLSRRSFAKRLAVAGGALLSTPLRAAVAPKYDNAATYAGVKIGANSESLPQPIDRLIRACNTIGIGGVELHPQSIEPNMFFRPPAWEPAAVSAFDNRLQHEWRLGVPLELFTAVGDRLRAAGIEVRAYNMNYQNDFTDAEIERTFDMAEALGTRLITAVGPHPIFRRLDAVAKRRKVRVGIHNEPDIPDLAAFERIAAGLSDYTGFTLDIGHFTASGGDSMAMLRKHGGRVYTIHLRDRRRDMGPIVPLGTGDAPIAEVLRWLRDTRSAIPANIEQGMGDNRVEGLRLALEHCRKILLN